MQITFELDDHEDSVTPIDTAAALLRSGQFTGNQLVQIANHILIAVGVNVTKETDNDW